MPIVNFVPEQGKERTAHPNCAPTLTLHPYPTIIKPLCQTLPHRGGVWYPFLKSGSNLNVTLEETWPESPVVT